MSPSKSATTAAPSSSCLPVGLDHCRLVDHEGPGEGRGDAELGQAPAPEDVEGVDLDVHIGERRFAEGEVLGKVREANGQHVR